MSSAGEDGCDGLLDGVRSHVAQRPDAIALEVGGASVSYAGLWRMAGRVAAAAEGTEGTLGVFGHRSVAAFSGVLAGLRAGVPYVPLNPKYPADRIGQMLERADCGAVVVESGMLSRILPALGEVGRAIRILLVAPTDADKRAAAGLPARADVVTVSGEAGGDGGSRADAGRRPRAGDVAYILFTSGSTGTPKGVAVRRGNVDHYLRVMEEQYSFGTTDRFSQTFDLTFDLSVFDMLMCWRAGGTLCVPTEAEKQLPGRYVDRNRLTVWFSVPSTVVLMMRLRMLSGGRYPSLRYALFCGEPLLGVQAEAFAKSAPRALIENLYGPTEATISCFRYRVPRVGLDASPGCLPIGSPNEGTSFRIVAPDGQDVPDGEVGELWVGGPQVAAGYVGDAARTEAQFPFDRDLGIRFYRTGDLVQVGDGGEVRYVGRADHQVKISGYRVELGDVESTAAAVDGVSAAAAVMVPAASGGADEMVLFVSGRADACSHVQAHLLGKLPPYMQPRAIILVEAFPLTPHGKIDRKMLKIKRLESRRQRGAA